MDPPITGENAAQVAGAEQLAVLEPRDVDSFDVDRDRQAQACRRRGRLVRNGDIELDASHGEVANEQPPLEKGGRRPIETQPFHVDCHPGLPPGNAIDAQRARQPAARLLDCQAATGNRAGNAGQHGQSAFAVAQPDAGCAQAGDQEKNEALHVRTRCPARNAGGPIRSVRHRQDRWQSARQPCAGGRRVRSRRRC